MKLKFINLYTADLVLTYLRTGFYILYGLTAFLNYEYYELRNYQEAPHIVRQALWTWLLNQLTLGMFSILVGLLTIIVALSFLLHRSPGLKYLESGFHFVLLVIAFVGTAFMSSNRYSSDVTAAHSVVRFLCTEHIQGLFCADFFRLLCINGYLKRSLLKAQEKA